MSQCGKNHPRDLGAFLLGWFHLSTRASASLIAPPMVLAQGWVNNIPVERVWSLPTILCFGMDPTIHYIQGDEIKCVLSTIESYSIEKNGSKFSHLLTVRAEGAEPSLADFPAVFSHISHWYLSWNTAGSGDCI